MHSASAGEVLARAYSCAPAPRICLNEGLLKVGRAIRAAGARACASRVYTNIYTIRGCLPQTSSCHRDSRATLSRLSSSRTCARPHHPDLRRLSGMHILHVLREVLVVDSLRRHTVFAQPHSPPALQDLVCWHGLALLAGLSNSRGLHSTHRRKRRDFLGGGSNWGARFEHPGTVNGRLTTIPNACIRGTPGHNRDKNDFVICVPTSATRHPKSGRGSHTHNPFACNRGRRHTCNHRNTRIDAHVHTRTHTRAYANTNAHTRTRARTHTHTHTNTHTHTHMHIHTWPHKLTTSELPRHEVDICHFPTLLGCIAEALFRDGSTR